MDKYTPKIVVWDIETSLMEVPTFSLWPKYIPHNQIIHDWYLICACWKELGKKKIHSTSVLDDPKRFKKDYRDDYHVVKTIRDMLDDVDILIHHNGDRFDIKKFNSRLIYHDLEPLPKIVSIDTLKVAKNIAKFTSNRLDYLGVHLGVGGKLATTPGLWFEVMKGSDKAVKEMVKYNKVDVQVLEDVYMKLRKYMPSHPNVAQPYTMNCTKCGSGNVHKHKVRVAASGVRRQQYQCQDCGGYFTSRKAEASKPLSK